MRHCAVTALEGILRPHIDLGKSRLQDALPDRRGYGQRPDGEPQPPRLRASGHGAHGLDLSPAAAVLPSQVRLGADWSAPLGGGAPRARGSVASRARPHAVEDRHAPRQHPDAGRRHPAGARAADLERARQQRRDQRQRPAHRADAALPGDLRRRERPAAPRGPGVRRARMDAFPQRKQHSLRHPREGEAPRHHRGRPPPLARLAPAQVPRRPHLPRRLRRRSPLRDAGSLVAELRREAPRRPNPPHRRLQSPRPCRPRGLPQAAEQSKASSATPRPAASISRTPASSSPESSTCSSASSPSLSPGPRGPPPSSSGARRPRARPTDTSPSPGSASASTNSEGSCVMTRRPP